MINPNEITTERRLEILHSLVDSTKCEGCGKPKQKAMSHCRACYYILPKALRSRLYQGFGSGYEEAFEESLLVLRGGEVLP